MPGVAPEAVLPTIGSKELVAWLPTLLGVGPGDLVGIPAVAYPTYDVGARLAGARPVVVDGLAALGPLTPSTTPKLVWLNSPGNPTGAVLPVEHLAKVVAWARRHGVVVASDECYAELDWRQPDSRRPGPRHTTPSILDPAVCGGSHEGCSRSTRCPSSPTSPATGRRSSPVTRHWSPVWLRCVGTPG